ncbi:MAG: dTDP-4-dehydrorhamnose reductase [Paludibacteraceae bacterium]|nr:dTDP-4-dehydrorhamnose reductase [Paludibacteraceae bacterium]
MKVLITGANGQLGNEMRIVAKQHTEVDFVFTDVEELNICNADEVDSFVKNLRPDYIVNCAAYTAVDKAEIDIELCQAINCDAVRNLGIAAEQYQAKIIHVSTDYVFDGTSNIPYTETMPTNPQTIYGKTKLEGEKALLSVCNASFIIRTSWLYSSFGNNFVKTMLRLGNERDSLNVVFDQVGTPTYAADLANVIWKIIISGETDFGVYHFSNEGVCSWYDFATAIFELSGVDCKVSPIESSEYPTKTPRPFYSVLNKRKIKSSFAISIPHWEVSLQKCLQILKEDN